MLLSVIPPESVVLYLGDSGLDVLPSLRPSYGLILHSAADVRGGLKDYPNLHFSEEKVTELQTDVAFDYVIMDEILPYIEDVFQVFGKIREHCHESGTLFISGAKRVPLLRRLAMTLARPQREIKNWMPKPLIETLLTLSGFSLRTCLNSCLIADAHEVKKMGEYSYSIMIPCYNEEGNIARCIARIPDLQRDHEIIVVNDGSTDRTADVVREVMKGNGRVRLIDYPDNRGKGYATLRGLEAARKDVLMILDADMTVRPEDLPLFIGPFESGHGEFVNGTRMVYPFDDKAMGAIHRFGNGVFSFIFSILLKQKVTDTLCGTKCLFRRDFQRIALKERSWPDFDLLFGASQLNLKIVEIPIHYQPRISGESKMKTFRHGFLLLKESFVGFLKLKLHWGH